MKRHYWQYLIDSAGNAVEGAKINVFLANTSVYANIQLTESAVSYTTTEFTDILTDSDGYFNFWISDGNTSPIYGYDVDQKFDITFSKAGYSTGIIEDVQIVWNTEGGKVKVDENDENADYLYNKLLEGNNISIATSGEQVVIGFQGIADTYKVKLDESDTEDYLENKLVAGDNITIETSASQLIVSSTGGGETIELSYTNFSVSPSASTTLHLENFMNKGLVFFFQTEYYGGENSTPYDIEIYGEEAMTTLMYQVIGIDPLVSWEDMLPFWYRDLDLTSKLHIKLINYGSWTLQQNILIKAEKFG